MVVKYIVVDVNGVPISGGGGKGKRNDGNGKGKGNGKKRHGRIRARLGKGWED